MCNVLKLYFGLKAKRLWRMLKDLGVMAAPALFLFLLMGILTVTGLVSAPIYYSVSLYVFLLLAYHFTRGDSAFLFSVFGKRYTKMLFVVEYMLLSIRCARSAFFGTRKHYSLWRLFLALAHFPVLGFWQL